MTFPDYITDVYPSEDGLSKVIDVQVPAQSLDDIKMSLYQLGYAYSLTLTVGDWEKRLVFTGKELTLENMKKELVNGVLRLTINRGD